MRYVGFMRLWLPHLNLMPILSRNPLYFLLSSWRVSRISLLLKSIARLLMFISTVVGVEIWLFEFIPDDHRISHVLCVNSLRHQVVNSEFLHVCQMETVLMRLRRIWFLILRLQNWKFIFCSWIFVKPGEFYVFSLFSIWRVSSCPHFLKLSP